MKTSAVVPFRFESHDFRAVVINDEPWFVAADICKALGLASHKGGYRHHLDKLDSDEKRTISRDAVQGTPVLNMGVVVKKFAEMYNATYVWADNEIWIVSESGLYALILRCKEAMSSGSVAHRFRKWVTAEVLPAISKTGEYVAPVAKSRNPLWPSLDESVALANTREGERIARELKVGMSVVQCIGLRGKRQRIEEGNRVASARAGVDCLLYFGLDLDRFFPVLAPVDVHGRKEGLVAQFIARELLVVDEDADRRSHDTKVLFRDLYSRFVEWYGQWVDHKLRGVINRKSFGIELRTAGLRLTKVGGMIYVYGVSMVDVEVAA